MKIKLSVVLTAYGYFYIKPWDLATVTMWFLAAPMVERDKENALSAYHLNGIFGNSGENSNGTVHPGGMFSEKR